MKNVLRSAVGLAVCALLSASIAAQDGGLDVVKVRKNFYMIAGAGGNIGVQIGSDGIVLVNSGAAATTDKVLASLKQLTDLPIRYIIDADAGADFVGGNDSWQAAYTITNAPKPRRPGHDRGGPRFFARQRPAQNGGAGRRIPAMRSPTRFLRRAKRSA